MVWFQCEDCGENLKKPKLPNHFRICSAYKLSCIDCGEVFGQQSVQSHTQCITEAEKYGPKGQGKVSNGSNAKPNKNSKQHPDIDINVGLSERPPWFCSLCNTCATSRQTLLLHAEGKKHRAKARAHHAAKQPPKEAGEYQKVPTENDSKSEIPSSDRVAEPKDLPKVETPNVDPETAHGNFQLSKERKTHGFGNDGTEKKIESDTSYEAVNGEVVQAERTKKEERERSSKKLKINEQKGTVAECVSNDTEEEKKKKIKWKKLITSALKSNPDGVLKLRKLRKLVLKTLRESGVQEDESELSNILELKVNSSSRFAVDGKYVRLNIND